MNKKCIMVLGMHRGGTSALAGTLQNMGIYMGENLMKGGKENPKGFFELIEFKELNKEILNYFNTSWDDIEISKKVKKSVPIDIRRKMRKIIKDNFDKYNIFALKDPRMCFLLPIWEEVLKNIDIETEAIVIVRDPSEVFFSLKKRNNINFLTSFHLWHTYISNAETNTRNMKRYFVMFDDLIEKKDETINNIIKIFELNIDFEKNRNRIYRFLDKKLKHYNFKKTNDFYCKIKNTYSL
jgi:hypothetical protein